MREKFCAPRVTDNSPLLVAHRQSNIYILHLFEHQLTQSQGKCAAGQFQIVMPPSAVWMPSKSQMKKAKRERERRGGNENVRAADVSPAANTSASDPTAGRQAYRMTTMQSHIPANPEDDPPEYATARHPIGARPEAAVQGSGGRFGVPAPSQDYPRCELPAIPLSLPPEFTTQAGSDSGSTFSHSNSHHERTLSPSPLRSHSHSHPSSPSHSRSHRSSETSNHRESVLYSTMLGGGIVPAEAVANAGNEADGEDSSGDEAGDDDDDEDDGLARTNETTKMLLSTPTSNRRTRAVSWHADIAGGLDDDGDDQHDDQPGASRLEDLERVPRSPHSLQPASPSAGPTASYFSSPSHSLKARRRRYLMIYSAIFAIAYVTSLDANTGYLYLNFACSEFGALASFSTVAICQQMVYAIAKPPIAKLSDVFGRAEALLFSLSLYSMGYACVATANSLQTLIGGIVLQSAGNTGVQVLQSIIIADLTTAKWRGLVISLVNLPYLINFAVAGPLVDAVMQSSGWRVGYGIWIVIVPLAAAPLVIILAVGQRQARNAGLLERRRIFGSGCIAAVGHVASEIDALGLLLFTLAWTLILGPLTMAGHGSYSDQSWAAGLILTGFVLLGLFVFWETKAHNPIMPLRFLKNRAIVCVCLIGILDFASFYLSWTYLSAFVQIVKGWGQTQTGYFATTQNVTSTVVGILVGSLMACTRRFKVFLVGGVLVRIIGVGLMIRYRNSHDPTIMLVLCQLLQGIGGGSVAITMQIAAQICVRHADVAIVTALELLTTEIGAAMGSATAGLIFTTLLPGKLRANLPDMSEAELLEVYGSLSKVTSYPMGSQERIAIGNAWTDTMRELCIMATLILIPAIPLAVAIPDFILPDSHRRSRSNRGSDHHHHHHHRTSMSSSTFGGASAATSPAAMRTQSSPEQQQQQQQKRQFLTLPNDDGKGHRHRRSHRHRRRRRRGVRRDKEDGGEQAATSAAPESQSHTLTRPPIYSADSHDGFSSTSGSGTGGTHSGSNRSEGDASSQSEDGGSVAGRARHVPLRHHGAGLDSDADDRDGDGEGEEGSRTPQPYRI